MKLPRYILEHARPIALLLNGVIAMLATVSGIIHYNSRPEPAYEARVGSITVDLARLHHSLRFEHLQEAGLFRQIECGHCDFTRSRKRAHLREKDFNDLGLMGLLYLGRGRETLSLHFHGIDIPVGQQRLEEAVRALRGQFPGREDAIQYQSR